jgi:hypothetical protein
MKVETGKTKKYPFSSFLFSYADLGFKYPVYKHGIRYNLGVEIRVEFP